MSELKALHEKLAALRVEDTIADTEEKESKSFQALIAYAACDFGVNESVVMELVYRHFGVKDINDLNEGYRSALIRFLENMDIKQFIH